MRVCTDITGGFALTPNARGAAEVSAQAKKFHGGDERRHLEHHHQIAYLAHVHLGCRNSTETFGSWAARAASRRYTRWSRLWSGLDAETAFRRATRGGGKIVGSVRMPRSRTRISPPASCSRQDASTKPSSFSCPVAHSRPRSARRWPAAASRPQNTKILGGGESTFEDALKHGRRRHRHHHGFPYDYNHSPLNKEFVTAYNKASDATRHLLDRRPADGMHLIYAALQKTGGKADSRNLIDAAKGMMWRARADPLSVDPETRTTSFRRSTSPGGEGGRPSGECRIRQDRERSGPS